jgi:LacI family transcriptional regulator
MSISTIRDVARTAKVSLGTVSRVLRGHPSVSASKLRRVQKAIETLDYSPRRRTASMADLNPLEGKNLLLLLLGMDRSLASLPVVAGAIHGVQQAIATARAKLSFADVPGVDHVPEVLRREPLDGVIVKGALQGDWEHEANPELLKRLSEVPTVWVMGRPVGCSGDVVQANDMLVGQIAAGHLILRGHRSLAFLSPKPSHAILMRRQASFTLFAQQADADVTVYLGEKQKWHFPSPAINQVELVQGLVDQLLAERRRPTAIFAPDDRVGAMIARALAARGLQAGRDISLMSCNNDQPVLMGIHPQLTTIDVHADEIGRRAVDQLAWRMTHREQPIWSDLGIDPTLVEGDSVAQL